MIATFAVLWHIKTLRYFSKFLEIYLIEDGTSVASLGDEGQVVKQIRKARIRSEKNDW